MNEIKNKENEKRVPLNSQIEKSVYDFIEKHFGEPIKHSDHSEELIKLVEELIVKSH